MEALGDGLPYGRTVSANSVSTVEMRLQAQEDEIVLLKSSLADALRKLNSHEQQLPLLWQEVIAVKPAAAQAWRLCTCSDATSWSTGLLASNTPQSPGNHKARASYEASKAMGRALQPGLPQHEDLRPRLPTSDRAIQTDLSLIMSHSPPEKLLLAHPKSRQSLSLEDALSDENQSTKDLYEIETEFEEQGCEGKPTWTSGVEELIQPSVTGILHGNQTNQNHSGSSHGSVDIRRHGIEYMDYFSNDNLNPSPTGMEAQKKPFVRRNTEKLVKENPEKNKQKLARKTASTTNLLARTNSLESRQKELNSSTGSKRGTYSQGHSIKMFIRGRPITMYVPSNVQNYEELRMEPPAERLELDWVYGYRGRDCRHNLHLLPSGEVVYFTACVVVLQHVEKHTQRHYCKHTDCVRSLAIHPDQVRVASGQTAGVDKDGKPLLPSVHVWDSSTLVTLQQIGLGSFERGVGALAFSLADTGALLVAIDDSNEHMLSVWDCVKGTKQAEIKSTNEAVFAVEFNPTDSSNIITCGKSHVYFWTMSCGTLTKKQGIFGKYKKPKFIQCFVFSGTGGVLTGDSEGNILTWGKSAADVKNIGKGAKETYQILRQTRAHEGSVFTLCLARDGSLLSGGGKDRRVVRWNVDLNPEKECEIPEQFGAVRTIAHVVGEEMLVGTTRNAILRGTFSAGFVAIVQGHLDEMWGLATHPSCDVFLTCGHDRQVCLWDSYEHRLDWCTTLEESGLCADFCPNGTVVSVGLYSGRWLVLDLKTREVVWDCIDGSEQLSVMRYSPDGHFLAVGSHDNFIYIHNVVDSGRRYTRFGKCTGHSSFITHLDWSRDGNYIMSNSGDYEILYWDVAGGCKLLRNRFDSKDREWASYTCVLGFHVMGVWLEGSDGTDINALCRSHTETLVAVADDFCKVHLFQYPCPKPKAPSHKYEGHGSHVTNVAFTHSDSHLLSMGGKDTSILQWRASAPSHKYEGHGSHVTNVAFTHSDSHLLSMGGKDTSILQWRVVSQDRLASVSSASPELL